MTRTPSPVPPRFGWNLFLTLHAITYTMLWIIVLVTNFSDPMNFNLVPIILLWTPLLFVHIALHYHALGKYSSTDDSYPMYRAGYRDAMRDLVDMNRLDEDDYEAIKSRLQLSENGQNPLLEEKQKRSDLRQ